MVVPLLGTMSRSLAEFSADTQRGLYIFGSFDKAEDYYSCTASLAPLSGSSWVVS